MRRYSRIDQLDDVMDELGPNGGLVYCMNSVTELVTRTAGTFDDDYFIS
jgi:hypothetical protein